MDKTAVEYLDETLHILKENGWTKHRFKNTDGSYCVIGALRAAANPNNDPLVSDSMEMLKAWDCLDKTAQTLSRTAHSAIQFNDYIAQTPEEIYAFIETAKACAV